MILSGICRVHREYSWRPKARRAGRRRPGVYGLELGRSVRRVQGRGHIVAASHLQLVRQSLASVPKTRVQLGWKSNCTVVTATKTAISAVGYRNTHGETDTGQSQTGR